VDARRQPSIQNAPQVLYSSRDPPLEIRHLPGLRNSEDIGYVTFVLFPRHFSHSSVASGTISHIQLFRDYLHYHIKCSKAYMHSRMRHRVTEFQKVLNRAKTEVATTERKTARYASYRSVPIALFNDSQWKDDGVSLSVILYHANDHVLLAINQPGAGDKMYLMNRDRSRGGYASHFIPG